MSTRTARRPLTLGVALCAVLLAAPPATATGTDDGNGTVTVTALTNGTSDTSPVTGAVFELYPVLDDDARTPADIDADDLGEATLLEPTRVDGSTGPLAVPFGDYLLRHLDDSSPVEYADMLFSLPSEVTVDGALVRAHDVNVFPKPAPDVPPVVVEPEPTVEPAPVVPDPPAAAPTPQVPTGDLLGAGRDWVLVGAGAGLLALVAWLAGRGRRRGAATG